MQLGNGLHKVDSKVFMQTGITIAVAQIKKGNSTESLATVDIKCCKEMTLMK